jgi:hypothetical protein
MFMDDFRIDSLGFDGSLSGQTQDGSKKRSKQTHIEPQEEPTDEVTLSSAEDIEEQPPGYLPDSYSEEPK